MPLPLSSTVAPLSFLPYRHIIVSLHADRLLLSPKDSTSSGISIDWTGRVTRTEAVEHSDVQVTAEGVAGLFESPREHRASSSFIYNFYAHSSRL